MSPTHKFTEDMRDGFQEVANVALGLAADKVARSFTTFVELPVPKVHLIESADIAMALGNTVGENEVVAVTQPFYGIGISGEALLLVTDSSLSDLSKLMAYETADCEAELMLELASLLNGSCVQGFCEQLDIPVMLKHPVLYGQHYAIADLLSEDQLPWRQSLAIELNYHFEGFAINCDLVLLFHEASLPKLFGQMALLLE